jgi:uncharacterized membrane protein YfcA
MIGLILLGLAAGVLSGMAAGGGTVLVPGLVILYGIAQHKAQGAVLAAFFATQSLAAIGQWRQGNIKFKLAWWMVLGATLGALVGVWLAMHTRPQMLRKLYGWYLIAVGIATWIDWKPKAKAPERAPAWEPPKSGALIPTWAPPEAEDEVSPGRPTSIPPWEPPDLR